MSSQGLMAGTCDDVQLLFPREVDELHRISGYADGEVRVRRILRVVHDLDELLLVEDVHVEMMGALCEVTVEDVDQIADPLVSS